MAHVKGSRIIPRLKYLDKNDPGGIREKILSELEPELADKIRKGIIAGQWYPVSGYVQLHRLLDKYLGRGDGQLCRKLGRISAQEAFNGLYKMFFKFGSAEFVMTSAPLTWRQLYDSGSLRIQNESADEGDYRQYRMIIEEFDCPAEEIWNVLAGWVEGTLEMTGAKDIKVAVAARRVAPNSLCEIEAAWKTK